MPTFLFEYHGLYGRKRLWAALFVGGFAYLNLNNVYNVLANLATKLIYYAKERAHQLRQDEAAFAAQAAA